MTNLELAQQVESVLEEHCVGQINEDVVPAMIEDWRQAKSRFIDAFGGELMIRSDDLVTIERNSAELELIFLEFLSDLSIYQLYHSDFKLTEFRDFLKEQGAEAFFANKVVTDYTIDSKMFKKGMKISRTFKSFMSNSELLNKLQTRYSMILQDLKITGYLYLSVHPLDYLSISETNHNWHSCHSLDGEYANGNLNYMLDSTTVVAYLASDEIGKLRNFGDVEWNSKKWRMLFYIGEDNQVMAGSKNYPFTSTDFTTKCFTKLQNLFGGSWVEPKQIKSRQEAQKYMYNGDNTVHFNDCLLSNTQRGWISYTDNWNNVKMEVGRPFICIECGIEEVTLGDTNFACSECSGMVECICCGNPTYHTETVICDGEAYCEDCAWDVLVYCEDCDNYFHPDFDEVVYIESADIYCCADCAEAYDEIELEDSCYE